MQRGSSELHVAVAAYEAATDPSKWKDVLRELARHCGATKAALFTPVEGATQRFLWCDIGFDPAILQAYSDHWVKEDAWVGAADEQHLYVARTVRIGSSFLPWDRLQRTAFYNDFAVPAGVKGMVTTILFDEQDAAIAPRTHLSLFREPGEPEFEREHARFLTRVQPHLREAIEVYWALVKARSLPHAIKQTLDGLPEPIFLLRADGFIEHANPAASSVLSEAGLLLVKNGRLVGIAGDYRMWAAVLRQVVSGVGCVLPFTHIRGSTVRSGVIRLAPVRANPSYLTVWPAAAVVMAVELRNETDNHAAFTLLAARYSFTPTEVQVLQLLADGHEPRAIAAQLQIEITTVRTHLRSLFDKTGLRRQARLVRLCPG